MSFDFFNKSLKIFEKKYPITFKNFNIETLLNPNLVSNHVFKLPLKVKTQAENIFKNIFEISKTQVYINAVPINQFNPKIGSLLTSLDYHWDGENLKLIEINSNASSYLVGDLIYEAHNCIEFPNRLIDIIKNFKDCTPHGKKIFILDEFPEQENLYVEFLMYKEFLEQAGFDVQIVTLENFNKMDKKDYPNLIYNRYCDFNLQENKSQVLKIGYEKELFKLSPHPYFYNLLANKNRFLILSDSAFINSLSSQTHKNILQTHILKTQVLNSETAETAWLNKKNIFIKPSSSYGGKAVYRGATISRKKFDELIVEKNSIFQELAPPPEVTLNTPDGPMNFKYDLRFYGFEGTLQFGLARFYRGQVTNMRESYGGLTPLEFF